jgi:enediyne biosynthesis thioesterase
LYEGELTLVTLSCSMDYYAECLAADEIDVAMTLRDRSNNRITMDFDFRRGRQQVARGNQTVACMRRTATGVEPVEIPAELMSALVPFQ